MNEGMIDITPIVEGIITIAILVITTFIIPWVKGKVDAQKWDKAMRWVEIGVGAAEQIYRESGMGEKKKEYVLSFLESKGLKIDMESIDAMIEAAVLDLQGEVVNYGNW